MYLQRRTEKEKADLMTFEEMRVRLANRDAIREKQEQEERAEEEREFEEAARQRREYREAERRARRRRGSRFGNETIIPLLCLPTPDLRPLLEI